MQFYWDDVRRGIIMSTGLERCVPKDSKDCSVIWEIDSTSNLWNENKLYDRLTLEIGKLFVYEERAFESIPC